MIIGNNMNNNMNNNGMNNGNNMNNQEPNFTSNFNERFNTVQQESRNMTIPTTDVNAMQYSNTNSKSEMADKSFAMLQERYSKGLISLDEFTKKCSQLNKQREKQ